MKRKVAKVDETSLMLGRLETAMNVHNALLNKVDDKLTLLNGSVSKAHSRIDSVQGEMVTKTSAMKFIVGGGILSGAGASGIIQAFKSYLGIT